MAGDACPVEFIDSCSSTVSNMGVQRQNRVTDPRSDAYSTLDSDLDSRAGSDGYTWPQPYKCTDSHRFPSSDFHTHRYAYAYVNAYTFAHGYTYAHAYTYTSPTLQP